MKLGRYILLAVWVLTLVTAAPVSSWAQATNDQCTSFTDLAKTIQNPQQLGRTGILTSINDYIQKTVNAAASNLFNTFIYNSEYQNAVMAAATLMVTILGVAFAIGVMQASFGQLLKRLFVLGVIFAVIAPSGWQFFSDYVVHFFADGTDQLIAGVLTIGTGIQTNPGDSPFLSLDAIANYMISPDMLIALVGSMTSGGPYGPFMGFLLGWCFLGFLKMLVDALRVYAVSYVLRALLFGLAPVFIVFLMFEKTKPMFTAWVNALVNFSLKPILYFTFLSFFLVLISSATQSMFNGSELCWTQYQHDQGTPNLRAGWRFKPACLPSDPKYPNCQSAPLVGAMDWNGFASCLVQGQGSSSCPEYPINILDLLSFIILIYVASKFGPVVDSIANEISNSTAGVSAQAKMDLFGKGSGGDDGGKSGGPTVNPPAGGQPINTPPPTPSAQRTAVGKWGSDKGPGE